MKLKTGIIMLLVGIAIIGMTASTVSAWGPITHDAIGKAASNNDYYVYSGSVMADLHQVGYPLKDFQVDAETVCRFAKIRGSNTNEMKFANGWYMHAYADVVEWYWQPWYGRYIKLVGSDYLSFKYKNGQGYSHWCPKELLADSSIKLPSTVLSMCSTFNGLTLVEQDALTKGARCIPLPGVGNICMPEYIPSMIKEDYETRYGISLSTSKEIRNICSACGKCS